MNRAMTGLGAALARYLSKPVKSVSTSAPTPPDRLLACLRPGDVLLVEGNTRISTAIKYLTQSTWSHAALFVGAEGALILESEKRAADIAGKPVEAGDCTGKNCLIEADINEGVRLVGLDHFQHLQTRICRPVGLTEKEMHAVIQYARTSIGHRYDLRNVFDLARYLLPTPPVPSRFRRRMIALGSGDPSRAICSTLIAQAFQSIHYPILPEIELQEDSKLLGHHREILHIRHHSLFAPRDFDVSPYFQIIKPSLEDGFDFRTLTWRHDPSEIVLS